MGATPIVTRTLSAPGGELLEVVLFAPENSFEPDPETFPWQCRYELRGIERISASLVRTSYAAPGLDGMDALLAALMAIRGILDRLQNQEGITLSWHALADSMGGHGFPRAISTFLGPKFENEMIERMLWEERAFMTREKEYMKWLRRNAPGA